MNLMPDGFFKIINAKGFFIINNGFLQFQQQT